MQQKSAKSLVRKRAEKVPRDSRAARVRFLLRNIDAPQCLSGDPLLGSTSPHLARALVESAANQLAPRLRLIIARCDLGGELHEHVAADLGISRRHFYRERQVALTALYDALMHAIVTERPGSFPGLEIDGFPIERAEALSNAGFTSQAMELLEDTLGSLTHVAGRVQILLQLTELYDTLGHYSRAGVYLEAARHLVASDSLDSAACRVTALGMTRSQACLLWHRGEVREAWRQLEAGIRGFRSAVGVQSRVGQKELAKALLVLADVLAYGGSFASALAAALEAKQIAFNLDFQPALQTQTLTTLGAMRILAGVPSEAILPDLYTAYELAKITGFVRGIAEASNLLSKVFASAGLNESALHFGKAALSASLADCMNSEERLVLRCELAWAKVMAGDLNGAIETLRSAIERQGAAPPFTFGVPKILMAEIALASGDTNGALPLVLEASVDMQEIGSERGLGSALRVRAEIESALGNKRNAMRAIDEALALLARAAPATPLASAYQLSGRLTGNRRHKRLAAELAELFSINQEQVPMLEYQDLRH